MLLSFGVFAQEVHKVDAEHSAFYMIRQPKDSVHQYLGNATHKSVDSCSDIYYVYSSHEGKNIPIQFFYADIYGDGKLRVYKVEFVSRKSRYPTTDLREAFWIEYLKSV